MTTDPLERPFQIQPDWIPSGAIAGPGQILAAISRAIDRRPPVDSPSWVIFAHGGHLYCVPGRHHIPPAFFVAQFGNSKIHTGFSCAQWSRFAFRAACILFPHLKPKYIEF